MTSEYYYISALSHYIFCQRRCALVHFEQAWEENIHTAKGELLHKNVDEKRIEKRANIRHECAVQLVSHQYQLVGKSDLVEFENHDGVWLPIPVEFKKGKPKKDMSDTLQLVAQVFCLEEMMGVVIPYAFLYYFGIKKRIKVDIDKDIRARSEKLLEEFLSFMKEEKTPMATLKPCCRECSLMGICLPNSPKDVSGYISKALKQ